MNKTVVVIYGGDSPEREVSIVSGNAIAKGLKELGYRVEALDPADYPEADIFLAACSSFAPYIVFNALHGGNGENGVIQAMLQAQRIPYTGSRVKTSALCMDKILTSALVATLGVKTPPRMVVNAGSVPPVESILETLDLPLVVKPYDSGSSVGVSIVHKQADLQAALQLAADNSDKIIIEKYIAGHEIMLTVLGKKACPAVEVRPKDGGWYDYEHKYTKGATQYLCPAPLPKDSAQKLAKQAEQIYDFLDCTAYARIDFIWDEQDFWFIELNTLPGMTELSLTPMAAAAAGYNFTQLLQAIIDHSL